jgi:hypothetical protein
LPLKLHFDSREANLNSKPVRYHKLSRMMLEFNFTHSPGPNHSEIQERLQVLCTVGELCVLAFVGPDEIGDLVDDIDTVFD